MKLVTTIALAAVALMTTGCGGSTGPSNASFAAKADAICASTLNAAGGKLSGSETVAAVQSEEALRSTAITKFQALSPPLDRGPAFQAFLYEVESVQSLLRQLAGAAAAHEHARIESIEAQMRGVEIKAKTSATEAGLEGCE